MHFLSNLFIHLDRCSNEKSKFRKFNKKKDNLNGNYDENVFFAKEFLMEEKYDFSIFIGVSCSVAITIHPHNFSPDK